MSLPPPFCLGSETLRNGRLGRSSSDELVHNADVPDPDGSDMNDRPSSCVRENDETLDMDRYFPGTIEHDSDLASGIRGAGQGVEE